MVSVLDGQLCRTWYFLNNNRNHVINLYHDTITGVRSANLDFQEIRSSTGNSSLFMESRGHRIFFTVDDLPGYLEIKRSGWTGFAYSCVINDKTIPESTAVIGEHQDEVYQPKITGTTLTPDESTEHPVTWYVVRTVRREDGIYTQVHRRFKDFVELNSQVKANFKGNHLLSALPQLPEKPLKTFTDHRDPSFIADRSLKLEVFLVSLVNVPHVSDMICVKAFLGLMESVREHSVSFHTPQLGMALVAGNSAKAPYGVSPDNIAVVGSVTKPEYCEEVAVGDAISKINGIPIAGYSFDGIIARVRALPRPVVVHFIQVIGGLPTPPEGTKPVVEDSGAAQEPEEGGDLLGDFLAAPSTAKPAVKPAPVAAKTPAPLPLPVPADVTPAAVAPAAVRTATPPVRAPSPVKPAEAAAPAPVPAQAQAQAAPVATAAPVAAAPAPAAVEVEELPVEAITLDAWAALEPVPEPAAQPVEEAQPSTPTPQPAPLGWD